MEEHVPPLGYENPVFFERVEKLTTSQRETSCPSRILSFVLGQPETSLLMKIMRNGMMVGRSFKNKPFTAVAGRSKTYFNCILSWMLECNHSL